MTKKIFLFTITFVIFAVMFVLTFNTRAERVVSTFYYEPKISQDESVVAYIKRNLIYTSQKPLISIFIAEETTKKKIEEDEFIICVNNIEGSKEKCIKKVRNSVWQSFIYDFPQTSHSLYFDEKNNIIYGLAVTNKVGSFGDIFFSGIRRINPLTNEEDYVSDSYNDFQLMYSKYKDYMHNSKVIYSANDKFHDRVLYIVDRQFKKASFYIKDPYLSDYEIPDYAVYEYFREQEGLLD